jgi:hypothetical protein
MSKPMKQDDTNPFLPRKVLLLYWSTLLLYDLQKACNNRLLSLKLCWVFTAAFTMSMMVTATPPLMTVMETVTNVTVTPSVQDDVSALNEGSVKATSSGCSFGSKRPVFTLTQKGPRVPIQVGFYKELPTEFINSFMPVSILLASIMKKGDNGDYTY